MASKLPALPEVHQLLDRLKIQVRSLYNKPQLEKAENAESFTICHRASGGEINHRYLPDDEIATCETIVINICRAMLATQMVRDGFLGIFKSYIQKYTTAWFLQEASPEHKDDMNHVTDDFLQKIREEFPNIIVDDTWENPRMMACHFRRPEDKIFRISNQYICVNGSNLNGMRRAAIKAKEATADVESRENYQAFLFREVNCMLHEIAHVFITYLSKGRREAETPIEMKGPLFHDNKPSKGEAGRKLEVLVFGGTMEYMVDPDSKVGDGYKGDKCGTAYLVRKDEDDKITRSKILPQTIKRTVECDFQFPYECEKEPETREVKPLARGIEPDDMTDPLKHPMWEPRLDPMWEPYFQSPPPPPPPADS